MSAIATEAPARAQASAHSRPMPLAAPVMNTTLFSSNMSHALRNLPFHAGQRAVAGKFAEHGRAHVAPQDLLDCGIRGNLRGDDQIRLDRGAQQSEALRIVG